MAVFSLGSLEVGEFFCSNLYFTVHNQSDSWDSFIFVHEISSGCESQGFKHFCSPISAPLVKPLQAVDVFNFENQVSTFVL